jgi:hypothetical protein
MKLKVVIGTANENPQYYKFIPSQIQVWKYFGIDFVAVFVGAELPKELIPYKSHIIVWNSTPNLNSAYVAQMIRLYIPALLCVKDDECIMITDMDMLPASPNYYKSGLETYDTNAFIHYGTPDKDQLYMCYNVAHPSTWGKVFNIKSVDDIIKALVTNYPPNYGTKGAKPWFKDQEVLYESAFKYESLYILNKQVKRLEVWDYIHHIRSGNTNFVSTYDDIHFHESYIKNEELIRHALTEIIVYQSASLRE